MSSDAVVDSLHMIVFGGIAMTASALHRATGGQELTFTQWRARPGQGATPSTASSKVERTNGAASGEPSVTSVSTDHCGLRRKAR